MGFVLFFGFSDTGNALAEEAVDTITTAVSTEPTAEEIAAQEAAEYQKKLENQRKATRHWQRKADYWAHKLYRHVRHDSLPLTQSLDYEKYRTKVWKKKAKRLHAAYKKQQAIARMWRVRNGNFHLALRAATQRYHVSYSWLHACAHSEGHIHGYRWVNNKPQKWRGIDPFEMNHGGSDAGGWMQYMPGTLTSNVRNVKIPTVYKKWRSRVGQAYTAAYMFKIGQSRQWTGSGC